jgi:hypothetical protein
VTLLNNEKTEMIGMKPSQAIKLKNVPLVVKPYPKEELLPADGLYRHLYEPGELEGGQQRRATDMTWSWKGFRISYSRQDPGQRAIYHLKDGILRDLLYENNSC